MNYIKEINSFYDWLETNTLTDSAIVLWHALMHISNRAGWPDEFTAAISLLSVKTGLKKDAIGTARNRLQQAGRIKFISRAGQQSAIYAIIPFESFKQTQTPSQIDSGGITDTNTVTNGAQTPSQTAHKQLPLDILTDLSSKDIEIDRDRLLRAVNKFQLQGVGAYGLDLIYGYIGMVDTDVIELAIKKSEKKPLGYFQTTINNWISEGKTTADLVNPIPQRGEYKGNGSPRRGTGKPSMPVVTSGDQPTTITPQQREKMLERARRLAAEKKEDN